MSNDLWAVQAVVGENLFVRESGAVASQFHIPEAIEPYSADIVAAQRRIVLGKKSGLDSIRISLNSARKELYDWYYCPQNYCFDDVVESIKSAGDNGVFTMINYLIFPGITDQKEEVAALVKIIERSRRNVVHFKNLNIDPQLYLKAMGSPSRPGIGIQKVKELLAKEFPYLQFGYYNRTRENFFTDQSQNIGKRHTLR